MPPTKSRGEERRVGRHELSFSSLDKVLFPADKITKGELIDYYEAVAPLMLPHLRDRPLSLQRWPQGIGKPGFFQKEAPDYYPKFVERVPVEHDDGEVVPNAVCNNVETLLYLANQNVITLHTWTSRRDKIRHPDKCIFDFDPNGKASFPEVREGALAVRDRLRAEGHEPWAMVTGSRGIHVVIPLRRTRDFDAVAAWAHLFADEMAQAHPKLLTTEFYKDKRGDRVFVDWLRNQYAQTAAAPYTVRARKGAPVAVPVSWEEVESGKVAGKREPLRADYWTLRDAAVLLRRALKSSPAAG